MHKYRRVVAIVVVGLVTLFALSAGFAWAQTPAPMRAPIAQPPSVLVPGCPPVPCCCEDAQICVLAGERVCFTEIGIRSFVALFREAAQKGVESAVIRGFNATTVSPACKDCGPKK